MKLFYHRCMKRKTSITLSSDVLAKVDGLAGSKHSRSAVIERILRLHFRQRSRGKIHARDLERINAAADRLNSEGEDALTYQALKD
jgi:metal-responsive CopG/Arc/MetJ family transcriptional regulator